MFSLYVYTFMQRISLSLLKIYSFYHKIRGVFFFAKSCTFSTSHIFFSKYFAIYFSINIILSGKNWALGCWILSSKRFVFLHQNVTLISTKQLHIFWWQIVIYKFKWLKFLAKKSCTLFLQKIVVHFSP